MPTAYAQRGEAYCQKGDITHCVADFDEAMRIDPDRHVVRVLARHGARRRWRCRRSHRRSHEGDRCSDPGTGTAYVRRGRIYEAEGDKARAAADYRSALKIDPYDETTKQRLEAFVK